MTYLPDVHTPEETLAWMRDVVFAKEHVVVAEVDGSVVGYASFVGQTLTNMYVMPESQRRGVGSALLDAILQQTPPGLELWLFERNLGAIKFYERHGFSTVSQTSGDNAEGLPDRLMRRRTNDTPKAS